MKKALTKIQSYAIGAAKEKAKQANAELQSLLRDVAIELGINMNDPKGGQWKISEDNQYLERMDIPVMPNKKDKK